MLSRSADASLVRYESEPAGPGPWEDQADPIRRLSRRGRTRALGDGGPLVPGNTSLVVPPIVVVHTVVCPIVVSGLVALQILFPGGPARSGDTQTRLVANEAQRRDRKGTRPTRRAWWGVAFVAAVRTEGDGREDESASSGETVLSADGGGVHLVDPAIRALLCPKAGGSYGTERTECVPHAVGDIR